MPINDYVREDKAPMNVSIVATIKRVLTAARIHGRFTALCYFYSHVDIVLFYIWFVELFQPDKSFEHTQNITSVNFFL